MTRRVRSILLRHGGAFAAVVLATAARFALGPILGPHVPYGTYFVAVFFAGWFGGLMPALIALVFGAIAADIFFINHSGAPGDGSLPNSISLVIFSVVGISGAILSDSLRKARASAESTARQALAERERLRVTLASIADAVIAVGPDGRVSSMNRVAEGLTGMKARAAEGTPWREVFQIVDGHSGEAVEVDPGRPLDAYEMLGLADRCDLVARDGTRRAIDVSAAPIRDSDGRDSGIVLVFRDVDDRRQADLALRESERRFRQLADTMPQIVWTAENDGAVDYFNNWWYDYTGMSPEASLIEDGWVRVVHPQDRGVLASAREGALERADFFEAECRLRHNSGIDRWHLVRSTPARDNEGTIRRRYGTAVDIDDRKHAEDSARFLAEASAVLATVDDEVGAMAGVARLAVPTFADLCAVHFPGGPGLPRLVAIAPTDSDSPTLVDLAARVVHSGLPEMVEDLANDPQLNPLRHRGFGSSLVVPMKGRGGIQAAITFLRIDSRRRFCLADLGRASDLAHRAALAFDNARLYADLKEADRRKGELIETLGESEARFRMLADSISQLAWIANPDGGITWYNKRWYEYTGKTPEEMEGWGWMSVSDPEMLPLVLDRWQASISTGEPFDMVFPIRGADGSFRSFLTRANPVRDESGRVVRWCGTNTDVAERMEMEAALKEADRRKNVFLATLAHELRNPLAPIRNTLFLMGRDGVEDMSTERAMAERQVGHLARLVDDLMDVSRIDQGKIELRRAVVDVGAIVRASVESVGASLGERDHRLAVTMSDGPIYVNADPTRVEQILWNLLNNAIKYTEPGGRIGLTVEKADGEVVLRVEDTGTGIAPEMLAKVFEMFVQVGGRTDLAQGGLGIGLGLVRALVELHGGRISARSAGLGAGSCFEVRLPRLDDAAAAMHVGTENGVAVVEDLGRRRILVVDDNRDAADSLAKVLARVYGQEVRTAYDGASAVDSAAEFRPHLVLLDIGMPGMDGYETARVFRSHPSLGATFLAALTGWGQESDRAKSREAGFDRHLVKPVDPEAVVALLPELP